MSQYTNNTSGNNNTRGAPTPNNNNNNNNNSSSANNASAPPLPTRKTKNPMVRNSQYNHEQSVEDFDVERSLITTSTSMNDLKILAKNYQAIMTAYKKKNATLENDKNELIKKKQTASGLKAKLEKKVEDLGQQIELEKRRLIKKRNDTDLEIQELKKNLRIISEAASKYQSELGNATNVRWDDDDINNTVQLAKWITEIQNTLNDFANIKGKDVEIDEEMEKNANLILAQYRCRTRLGGNVKTGKPVLSAALQRLVLNTLFTEIDRYLDQYKNQIEASIDEPMVIDDRDLEAGVAITSRNLSELLNELIKTRQGEDDTSRIAPVKIRQQIYAVLGTRGFCEPNHPFIKQLIKVVLDLMQKYRKFKTEEKISDSEVIAEELVLQIVHLYFRMNAQEPVPDFRDFFESGVKIQTAYMEGSWDDSSINELEVEICSFPLIFSRGKESKKVLCKAQVLSRKLLIN